MEIKTSTLSRRRRVGTFSSFFKSISHNLVQGSFTAQYNAAARTEPRAKERDYQLPRAAYWQGSDTLSGRMPAQV